jgi:hypothetical protein
VSQPLVANQVVVLALDGTLVLVEDVQPTFAAVVALPDQLTPRPSNCVFTPGRVGAKKISPFSQAQSTVEVDQLSDRNKSFLESFMTLRDERGPNHIDRTQAELDAMAAAGQEPERVRRPKRTPEEKAAARAAKPAGKREAKMLAALMHLLKCQTCGERKSHANHEEGAEGAHEFVPPIDVAAAPAAEATEEPRKTRRQAERDILTLKCQTCGEQRGHFNHPDQHEFVAPPEDAAPVKPERVSRSRAKGAAPATFKWVGTDDKVELIASMNPKYRAGNSGHFIVEAIKAGASTLDEVMAAMAAHTRWSGIGEERVQVALGQLATAKVIE